MYDVNITIEILSSCFYHFHLVLHSFRVSPNYEWKCFAVGITKYEVRNVRVFIDMLVIYVVFVPSTEDAQRTGFVAVSQQRPNTVKSLLTYFIHRYVA